MPVKTAKLSDFTSKREIAAGGEGKIYEHPHDNNKVVKIYHQARKSGFVKHLEKISILNSQGGSMIKFIVPFDIFVDSTAKCLGFEMEYVDFNNYWLFNNLFNKGFCSSHGIDKGFKIKILEGLSTGIKILHSKGITVGDLNQYNLFVSKKAEILFVDTDSYATSDSPHSGVLLDDIRDWTTTAINEQTDDYAYDVLCFWATTYCHPYKWVVPGNKESLEMRVKANKSILSKIPNIKIPPLFEAPIGDLLKQFSEIFNSGRRYMVSLTGVHIPVSVVIKQPVAVSNNLSIRTLYDNITEIYVSNSYIAIKAGLTWVLHEANVQKITRQVKAIDCDELFPSNSSLFAYRKGNDLYAGDGKLVKSFIQPVFYYNNSYLCVIEYASDLQWNYNLNNQLAGIDNTNTPVFAKSIIKRMSLLQNFGSQIYFNVPSFNRYAMIRVPKGTKDGFYLKSFIVVEVKEKNTVSYRILDTVSITTPEIEFDYFPHIAVGDGIVFVPENGYVDVYKNLQLLTRLECSICTRDSKLFYTKSGILLLEDKVLYLLNTK